MNLLRAIWQGLRDLWKSISEELDRQHRHTMPYRDYLKTEHWKTLRYEVKKRDRFKCVECGSKERLQVHHLTYERRGYEEMTDLVTLCEAHHEAKHAVEIALKRSAS